MRYLPVDIGLPFSVAAFCRAKKCNHVSGAFCYYVSGRSNSRQFQMLSCKAAQGNDLPKVYKAGIGGPMKPISD